MSPHDVSMTIQRLHCVTADVRDLITQTDDRAQLFTIHDELKRAEAALTYLTTAALTKVDVLLQKDV